jgi:hypothetical protein
MSTSTVDFGSIAKQAGAVQVGADQPASQPQPAQQSAGDFAAIAAQNGGIASQDQSEKPQPTAKPFSAAYSKFTTPENYQNWLKTAPKAGPNIKPGEYEAWVDAHTPGGAKQALTDAAKPVAAGAVTGAAALALPATIEALPSVLPHTVEGVKAIGTWAAKNPVQAYVLYQVMKDLIPGARKAMGLAKGMPEIAAGGQ